jgi:hypothetical protein
MTSLKQIEANRANARRSTGPVTEEGKLRSRCNAVRHGLTAETVIGALEDADDYRAFEQAIIADYDAQSAVERELVLRLASLLWRLRRATTMETGLFDTQADHLNTFRQARPATLPANELLSRWLGHDVRLREPIPVADLADGTSHTMPNQSDAPGPYGPGVELARCFLRLANLPNFALDRLSRYEASLWRQAGQILFALDAVSRRNTRVRRPVHSGRPADFD